MGDVVKLKPRKPAPKPSTSPRPAAASAMLREFEQVRRNLSAFAASPLCTQMLRDEPAFAAAAERARADMLRGMRALGMIR